MNKTCQKYDTAILSAFADNELGTALLDEINSHLDTCPDCSRVVSQYVALSRAADQLITAQTERIDTSGLSREVSQRVFDPGAGAGFFNIKKSI